jgi:hypothetical protein
MIHLQHVRYCVAAWASLPAAWYCPACGLQIRIRCGYCVLRCIGCQLSPRESRRCRRQKGRGSTSFDITLATLCLHLHVNTLPDCLGTTLLTTDC